jgi:AraC-like DNA-binding protein
VIPTVGNSGLMLIDLGCRGAAVGLFLLLAGLSLRDRPGSTVARLAAVFAVDSAAYAIRGAPGFPSQWQWWSLPILALCFGSAVVFWLWARAAFDDDFVLRRWHGALWGVIVALGLLITCAKGIPPVLMTAIGRTLTFWALGLALLAAAQLLATWRADLMEGRRRLRGVVLIGTLIYVGTDAIADLSQRPAVSGLPAENIANAVGLWVLAAVVAWNLLRVANAQNGSGLLTTPANARDDAGRTVAGGEDRPPAVESALLRRLERLMTVERAYRREGLTIGPLAAELGVPEYRLRQLINEGLGHRNFNAFLNRYRLDEAKAALADPEQKEVPVLTIALDAGFQSIGPFNRAFKADTNVTPTEFRRAALADATSRLPNKPLDKPAA